MFFLFVCLFDFSFVFIGVISYNKFPDAVISRWYPFPEKVFKQTIIELILEVE